MEKNKIELSIIVPVFDEEGNIEKLHDELTSALNESGKSYEIIYVDDGSEDNSFSILSGIVQEDKNSTTNIKAIRLRRNYGQTAALMAGFDNSTGDIVITIDADLQNDPKDIKNLLTKIEEGYDVVSGWRKFRKDKFLTRIVPSKIANNLISFVIGIPLNDYGCSLKAYKREILDNIRLYGEMHRFIPAYASWVGAKIAEVAVNHRPRIHGKSKYGLIRIIKVILDLLTVKFFVSGIQSKPIYLFGAIGLLLGGLGTLFALGALYEKIYTGTFIHTNPLIILSGFALSMSLQFILTGLLAEIIIRTYFESRGKGYYLIKDIVEKDKS